MRRGLACLGWSLVLACGSSDAPQPQPGGPAEDRDAGGVAGADAAIEAPAAALFDPAHVVEVAIELSPADWDLLRGEGRSPVDIFTGCVDREFSYTFVPGRVTVDGETLDDVGVRKKGYLGSLSRVRPSLKLDFAELVPAQRLAGDVKRMTLNNDRQDRSHTHQCMSYDLFRAAGAPAPRCNLAHVRVNGEDLGVYTHVESIKKPFLAQHFDDVEGNLYEGQGADFRPGFVDRLELKNNEQTADRSDAQALTDALGAADSELEAALAPLVDLDAFETFWAMEVLTSHWDGYSGDTNNYFVYSDPGRGFVFIPWGTDGAFSDHAFLPDTAPASVYAVGQLSRRLYDQAATRDRYRARLSELLDTLWDEDALLDQVDRIAELAGDAADPAAFDAQRAFVRDQRARLSAELGGPAPDWTFAPRPLSSCRDVATQVTARFSTTWGALSSPAAAADNQLELEVGGTAQRFVQVLSAAGRDPEGDPPQPVVRVVGVLADGTWLLAQVSLGPVPLAAGEIPLHGMETVGFVLAGGQGTSPRVLGLFGDGSLVLDEASEQTGATVRGSFAGRWVPLPGLFR